MNLEDNTSFVLRYGSLIGVMLVAIGVIMHAVGVGANEEVMIAGIAVIVFTPFACMIISFTTLAVNRERRYAIPALALILITVVGMAAGYYLG